MVKYLPPNFKRRDEVYLEGMIWIKFADTEDYYFWQADSISKFICMPAVMNRPKARCKATQELSVLNFCLFFIIEPSPICNSPVGIPPSLTN